MTIPVRIVATTDERVRKAAATCRDAERVLRELFPDAFKDDDFRVEIGDGKNVYFKFVRGTTCIPIWKRMSGNLADKGLFLGVPPEGFRWGIEIDNEGMSVLILVKTQSCHV